MSEYTTDRILDMIKEQGSPANLPLSGQDLSRIDLSAATIQKKRVEGGWPKEGKEPPWYSQETEGINLQGANLTSVNLQGAHLQGAYLGGASLSKAKLQRTDLSDANLQGAILLWASLQGAYLFRAKLQGARLWGANLQDAALSGANLQGATFLGAHLERLDLRPAQSLQGAHFRDAFLDRTYLRWEQIKDVGEERKGHYERARLAYLGLKVNFKSIGYYDDARWAHLKERRMERKACFPSQEGDRWVKKQWDALPEKSLRKRAGRLYRALLYIRLFLRCPQDIVLRRRGWALNGLEDLFLEYMESPLRIIAWMGVFGVVVFPLLYWLSGAIEATSQGQQLYLWDYPIFSLRTAVTLAFNDLQPQNWAGKVLTSLQGALGVVLFALFGYSIAKRIARD